MKKKTYIVIFVNPSQDSEVTDKISHSTAIMVYKDYKLMIKTRKLTNAWVKILESDGRPFIHFGLVSQHWHFQ